MKQVLSKVTSNNEITPGVYLIWFESPQIAAIAQPGQFVMVKCGHDNLLRRPFSIHQIDAGKTSLALLFSTIGKGTHWLSRCKADDRIDLLGPLGNGFTLPPSGVNILLIAGGIGIAPLPFLARTVMERNCSATLLMGASTATQLCPENLLPPGIDLIVTTEDGSAGEKGMITDSFRGFVSSTISSQVFACGPSPMYRAMAKMPELKNKPVQVSLEVRMGCGFGLCYGCTVKTKTGLKQVCKDGPVFELDDILWDEFVDI